LSQFLQAVAEKDGRDAAVKYCLLLGFEEQVHNLDRFFKGHTHADKLAEMLGQFESRMFDMALRQPGAALAFRAYEQVFDRLIATEGKLPSLKTGPHPDTGKIWINDEAKQIVEDTLKAYCKEHNVNYEEEFGGRLDTIMRTGWKIFIFSLRGDEIQASTTTPRTGPEAPWHEDLWRRLDPPGMPMKYWTGSKHAAKAFLEPEIELNPNEKKQATTLWYFFTGDTEKDFKTVGDYAKAVEELEEKGEMQLNLFNIGGVLSKSDWRATFAIDHIVNPEKGGDERLAPFLGVEMHRKLLEHELGDRIKAKEEALTYSRIRNPLALFRLADEKDKNDILNKCGVNPDDPEAKKKFLDLAYEDMGKALQRLVYGQQEGLQDIVGEKEKARKKAKIEDFLKKEKDRGLDFSFIENIEQRKKLQRFTEAIQTHFTPNSQELKELAKKRFPFSMGTEDVPMELMLFAETGDVGLQRRFRDVTAACEATGAFWKIIKGLPLILQKEDKIIESLVEIEGHLDAYGPPDKDNIMMGLTSRILDMTSSDEWLDWIPWPFQTLIEKYTLTSKAEKLFGEYHMTMSANEQRNLVDQIIAAGCFTTMKPNEVRKLLFKKHNLRRADIWWERIRKWFPIGLPVGLGLAAGKVIYDQLKKDVEEMSQEV
jgi:hypothetical protein